MTNREANKIYDILVSEAKAIEDNRMAFVHYQEATSIHAQTEWRFGGALGFGGKFRIGFDGRWLVDQYPEDSTDKSRKIIARVNESLVILQEEDALTEGSVCPECESTDINGDFRLIETGIVERKQRCNFCKHEWIEVYELCGEINKSD